jgi:hypothetical protein
MHLSLKLTTLVAGPVSYHSRDPHIHFILGLNATSLQLLFEFDNIFGIQASAHSGNQRDPPFIPLERCGFAAIQLVNARTPMGPKASRL